MNDGIRVVFVSIPREDADSMARSLVEERLAACVNIVSKMESYYRWEGKVLSDSEALLIIKTHQDRFEALQEYVLEHHHYELPEIIAIPVTEGLSGYLDWVAEATE